MAVATERRIRTIDRKDGKARLFIVEREDGLFRFEGEAEIDDGDGSVPIRRLATYRACMQPRLTPRLLHGVMCFG